MNEQFQRKYRLVIYCDIYIKEIFLKIKKKDDLMLLLKI